MGQVDVADGRQAAARCRIRVAAFELRHPGGVLVRQSGEEDLGAVGRLERGELLLVDVGSPEHGRGFEPASAFGRGGGVSHLEADGGQGRRPLASQPLVAHDPGAVLGPQSHRLGAVVSAEREAELAEEYVDLAGVLGLHLHEVEGGRLSDVGQPGGLVGTPVARPRCATWSSCHVSERCAWSAVRRTSVCRKTSLKTSRDNGPVSGFMPIIASALIGSDSSTCFEFYCGRARRSPLIAGATCSRPTRSSARPSASAAALRRRGRPARSR